MPLPHDLLASARDRCVGALSQRSARDPLSSALAAEALSLTGHAVAARRLLDDAVAALDADDTSEARGALSCAAMRMGRGEVLRLVRERAEAVDGDALESALLAGRLAFAAGDQVGVDAIIGALERVEPEELVGRGRLGDALCLALDARSLVDDDAPARALIDALTPRVDALDRSDASAVCAVIAALARLRDARVDSLARDLVDAVPSNGRPAGPSWSRSAARVALFAQDALATLGEDPAERAAPRVVLCNVPPDDADRLADALIAARVAACVNVVPKVRSVYRWEGSVAHDEESTLLIKTTVGRVDALRALLGSLHPYELPEVLSLAPREGECSADYLRWVSAEVRPPRPE